MSQTETLLLIALGFALAVVFFLVFGFAMWSTANRWTAFRRRKEIPTTILDMQAEREALRASNAMTTVKFETLLQKSRDDVAEKTAEVSRHRNRLVLMGREVEAKNVELAKLADEVKTLTVETNARAQIIARLTGKEVANLRVVPASIEAPKPTRIIFEKPSMPVPPLEMPAQMDKLKSAIAGINAASAEISTTKPPAADPVAVEDLRTASEALEDPAPKSADIIDFKRIDQMANKSLADRFRNLANGMKVDGEGK